ncbi:MAG: hypothetical protein EOO38_19490 [Cytophagaceae bacterium]|nr:MAG: hypothetical protein EOO38_19490 [Cytophagaceae bacterium]
MTNAIYRWFNHLEFLDLLDEAVKYDNPSLHVKINNNSANSMSIDFIEVKVKRSSANHFPLLLFEEGDGNELPLFNWNAGTTTNTEMYFSFFTDQEPFTYQEPFKYHLRIPQIYKPQG